MADDETLVQSNHDGVEIYRHPRGNPKAKTTGVVVVSRETFKKAIAEQVAKHVEEEEKAVARDSGNNRRAAIMAQREKRKNGS